MDVERRLLLGALCAGMALAGCGASRSATTTSRSERAPTVSEPVPTESIEVSIPTLLREGYIPKRYTCDGADVSLPLRWSHLPSGTAELAIFVINLQPVHGRFFFDWALAGLSARLHGISAGTLASGAVVGRNSFGKVAYSICPAKGTGEEHYVVRVIALPHPIAARSGFDAETLYREAERSAKVVGLGGGAYKPPGS